MDDVSPLPPTLKKPKPKYTGCGGCHLRVCTVAIEKWSLGIKFPPIHMSDPMSLTVYFSFFKKTSSQNVATVLSALLGVYMYVHGQILSMWWRHNCARCCYKTLKIEVEDGCGPSKRGRCRWVGGREGLIDHLTLHPWPTFLLCCIAAGVILSQYCLYLYTLCGLHY